MKISEVLRESAWQIEDEQDAGKLGDLYSCIRVRDVSGAEYVSESEAACWYTETIACGNEMVSVFWGNFWGRDCETRNDCRILALCLAAAIAESEGL